MGVVFSTAGPPYYDSDAPAAMKVSTKTAEDALYSQMREWPHDKPDANLLIRKMIGTLVNETDAAMTEFPGSPSDLVKLAMYGKWHQTILPACPKLPEGTYDLLTVAVDSIVTFYMSMREATLSHADATAAVMRVVARVEADIAK